MSSGCKVMLEPVIAQDMVDDVARKVLSGFVGSRGMCCCGHCLTHLVDRASLAALQVVDNTKSLDVWLCDRGRDEVFIDIYRLVKAEAKRWRYKVLLPCYGKIPLRRRPGRLQLDSRGLGIAPSGFGGKSTLN